jgi:hypothetical protein
MVNRKLSTVVVTKRTQSMRPSTGPCHIVVVAWRGEQGPDKAGAPSLGGSRAMEDSVRAHTPYSVHSYRDIPICAQPCESLLDQIERRKVLARLTESLTVSIIHSIYDYLVPYSHPTWNVLVRSALSNPAPRQGGQVLYLCWIRVSLSGSAGPTGI